MFDQVQPHPRFPGVHEREFNDTLLFGKSSEKRRSNSPFDPERRRWQ
jgi:hypothetical protein